MWARSATAAVAVLGLFAGAVTAQDFGEKTLRLGDVPLSADKTFRLGDAPAAGADADPASDIELIWRCGFHGCGYRGCGYRGCGFYGCYRPCYSYAAGFCGVRSFCYRPYYCGAACYSP